VHRWLAGQSHPCRRWGTPARRGRSPDGRQLGCSFANIKDPHLYGRTAHVDPKSTVLRVFSTHHHGTLPHLSFYSTLPHDEEKCLLLQALRKKESIRPPDFDGITSQAYNRESAPHVYYRHPGKRPPPVLSCPGCEHDHSRPIEPPVRHILPEHAAPMFGQTIEGPSSRVNCVFALGEDFAANARCSRGKSLA